MEAQQKRIERAWQACKDWITDFDGSASETYLTGVKTQTLPAAFQSLAGQSRDFRVSIISGEDEEAAQFISPEALQSNLERLLRDEIVGLNANYSAALDGFDLDVHLVIETVGKSQVDLELIWWADQVFSEEDEAPGRFKTLLGYFTGLQDLFHAEHLYLGPESFDRPTPKSTIWVEV